MRVQFKKSGLMEEALGKIRDKHTPPPEFRKQLRKLGRYLIYEASKKFSTRSETIETPLSKTEKLMINTDIVIISVLRAALPMVDAIFEEFDNASLGVVSASRGEMLDNQGRNFEIKADYINIPNTDGKIAVIVDPMLATASTISYLLDKVKNENPTKLVLIVAIASKYGIELIETQHPEVEIYCAAVDNELDKRGYIVPGLGDAGDRACNTSH